MATLQKIKVGTFPPKLSGKEKIKARSFLKKERSNSIKRLNTAKRKLNQTLGKPSSMKWLKKIGFEVSALRKIGMERRRLKIKRF